MITYLLLLVTTVLHIADIVTHTEQLARWTMRVAAVGVILIWARLLKFARVSTLLGECICVYNTLLLMGLHYRTTSSYIW